MIPKRIAGANAAPGKPKDWSEDKKCGQLPIRVEGEGQDMTCTSAWEPTPKELEMLAAGGQVILRVCGWQVPVLLTVEMPA